MRNIFLALCVCAIFPATAHAAAPPETIPCGHFTYTLPPGYIAKKDAAPLISPHTILLNPPFKKSEKEMWESQLFCLEDGIRTESGSAFKTRQSFYVRSTAKLSHKLAIRESFPLPGGRDTLYLLGKTQGGDNPHDRPFYGHVIPVIELTDTADGRTHYLVFVERHMGRWPDKMLPEESREEKQKRMRKLAEDVYSSRKPETIGIAEMAADGAIVLRLNAPLEGATAGNGYFRYPVGDARYQDILNHVGPLKPGESRPVRPWPENTDQQAPE